MFKWGHPFTETQLLSFGGGGEIACDLCRHMCCTNLVASVVLNISTSQRLRHPPVGQQKSKYPSVLYCIITKSLSANETSKVHAMAYPVIFRMLYDLKTICRPSKKGDTYPATPPFSCCGHSWNPSWPLGIPQHRCGRCGASSACSGPRSRRGGGGVVAHVVRVGFWPALRLNEAKSTTWTFTYCWMLQKSRKIWRITSAVQW